MTELPLSIDTIEEDVLLFSFIVAGNRIECITNFVQDGPVLRLFQLHLGGFAQNQVGRPALWQIGRQIAHYFKATTLIVEGGRRTTGRYKGKIPKPITINCSKN